MKDSGMDDWLVDAIMEFYSIIKAGYASKTTNVFEEVMRQKPITFNLQEIMHKLLSRCFQYLLHMNVNPI
jgi:hypothetical protein